MNSGSREASPLAEPSSCFCIPKRSGSKMGSLRELQHALQEKNSELKMRDSRIIALEQELRRRDDIIRRLESELDKYRSVLQPATSNTSRSKNPRLGISAEPQGFKTVQETSKPLKQHAKTARQDFFIVFLFPKSFVLSGFS